MATKVTELTTDAAPDLTDAVMTVNDPSGTPASRQATVANLLAAGDAWGEIYIDEGVTAQVGIDTTPTIMTAWNAATGFNGESLNTTPAKASNKITVNSTGTYLIIFTISASGDANDTFHWEIYIDGVASDRSVARKIGSGGDIGAASFSALLALTSGEDVEIYVDSDDASGSSLTVQHASLIVERKGA